MTILSNAPAVPDARTALLVKAARMYHEEGLLQPEIASRLGLSQSRVSRLLTEAQRVGIVRTIVVAPPGLHSELEAELRTTLGLRDAIVADAPEGDPALALPAVGAAAADHLAATVRAGERIGVSSRSAALLATLEALAPLEVRAESVVQTLGSVGSPAMRAQAPRLTDRLAALTGAEPLYLPAPGVVADRLVRDGLLSDPALAEAVEAWPRLSLLLTGIGALDAAPVAGGSALGAPELERLRELGAVGDVGLNAFDAAGRPVDGGLEERRIGIGGSILRAVPRRIGVAVGEEKALAIRAAALGGWIDVLVTDRATARRILALDR